MSMNSTLENLEIRTSIPSYYFSSTTYMEDDCDSAQRLNIYMNLKAPKYPSFIQYAIVELFYRTGSNPQDPFVEFDIVHLDDRAFRRTDPYYDDRTVYPEFYVDPTYSESILPDEYGYPVYVEIEQGPPYMAFASFLFKDDDNNPYYPVILDSHTFLKVSVPHCGFTTLFSAYGNNDTIFTLGYEDGPESLLTSVILRGSGIYGYYSLLIPENDEEFDESAFIGYPAYFMDVSEFPLDEYLDDVCQCGLGVPDRACQDPKIGPFNCKGLTEYDKDCQDDEVCILDTVHSTYLDYKNDRCSRNLKNYGNNYACDCGCMTEYNLPDLDCYYPGRYRTVTDDTRETFSFNAKCNGVTAVCNEIIPYCSGEKWTCDFDLYNDGTRCDCDCGVFDPDCENYNLPTTCPEDFACILNNTEDLTSMYCAAPKKWSCHPSAYKDGVTCDCNCTVLDPDCLNANASAISGCGSFSQKAWTCNSESKCIPAACGNGIIDPFLSEQCDGGAGCSSKCKCLDGYTPRNPRAPSCASICGDGIVTEDEECDSNIFCDSTCHCLPGHPYNEENSICSGCGNDIVDKGEECDGGEGCLDVCLCDIKNSYIPKNPPSSACGYKKKEGVIVGASVAAGVAALAAVGIVVFFIIKYRHDKSHAKERVNESENAVQMKKMNKERVDFDGTSTTAQTTTSVNMLATLDISQEGGGMTLDVDELERTQNNLSSTQLTGPTGLDADAGAGMTLDDD